MFIYLIQGNLPRVLSCRCYKQSSFALAKNDSYQSARIDGAVSGQSNSSLLPSFRQAAYRRVIHS